MKTRRRARPTSRRVLAPVLLTVGGLLLTGCGQVAPGTAAVVGDTRISDRQVQDVAAAQCDLRESLKGQQGVTATSRSKLTTSSLGLLMDTALSREYGDSQKATADPLVVKAFLSQVEPLFAPLPAGPEATLTSTFTTWAKARAQLVDVASTKTGQKPTAQNLEQLLNAGLAQRAAWLKSAKPRIDTDARYAPGKDGFPGAGDGSVSQAGSDYAKAAAKTDLDPTFAASLPASQKCG